MNEDPATPDPSSADAPADEENLFAVALAKNNNESFPVLNAFQRFLDQERERARRRVVTMAVCFTGAMVVMLLVFGILFATFFSRMMVRNERQQDRLLDLVVAGLPGAARTEPAPAAQPAPAVAAAPEPKEAPSAVTRDELLEILRQMNAAQAAPAPAPEPPPPPAAAPAAPAVVEIPVVPVPAPVETAAVPAPKPRKTGVISSPLRQDQEAKEAAEDAARRARAAAKAEAEAAAAAAEAAKTAAAPAPEPAPEPAPAAVAKEEKPDAGKRTIAVKPRSRMKVPEGFSTDRAELQTSTGATVPFRLLVPVPDASR